MGCQGQYIPHSKTVQEERKGQVSGSSGCLDIRVPGSNPGYAPSPNLLNNMDPGKHPVMAAGS